MSAATVCEHEAAHHSADTVTVWHGAPVPRVLCGYHALVEGWTA